MTRLFTFPCWASAALLCLAIVSGCQNLSNVSAASAETGGQRVSAAKYAGDLPPQWESEE